MNKQQITEILKMSTDERALARFDPDLLLPTPSLSSLEISRLKELFPRKADLRARQIFTFLVNLSFASSQLEGNTYSQIDTQTLIEDGVFSEENSPEEAQMILNHKRAFDILVDATSLDRSLILKIHAALATDGGIKGSRHFLEDEHLGMVRTFDEVSIGNTTYLPPVDYPGKRPTISDHLDAILAQAVSLTDPLEQALYLFTRLPYLQTFRDCNKRTSRLMGNLPLLLANEYPISFMGFDKARYNRAIVAFYEFGDTELFKEGFIDAYIHSALKFHPMTRETSIFVQSEQAKVRGQLADYVLGGHESLAVSTLRSDRYRQPTDEPGSQPVP
jgi:Fic family protein